MLITSNLNIFVVSILLCFSFVLQAAWRRYAGAQDYYGTWIAHSVMRARKEARRISRQTGKNIILSQNVLSANHVYHKGWLTLFVLFLRLSHWILSIYQKF